MPQSITKKPNKTNHGTSRRRCDFGDVLLTVKEIAELDSCSEKTVRRAIDAGRLRSIRIGVDGRLIRISKADHAAYRASFGR